MKRLQVVAVVLFAIAITQGCGLGQLVELAEDVADGGTRQLLPDEAKVFPHYYKWLCALVVRRESDAGSVACYDVPDCIAEFRAAGETKTLGCAALGCAASPPPPSTYEVTVLMNSYVPCEGK